ncbi:hypothetical protein [Streptomyces sp. NPDC051554]|uniref:hypothetical protein n=1 Tax=Streptomyces sp. NPDC051554 TaxID=3365656 RepID=UPI00378E8AA7
MHTFSVGGPDVTRAWIAACNALDRKDNPARTAFHTVVRITDPTADDLAFRAELDHVRATKQHEPTETVANTLFPAQLAARCDTHEELTSRYRALYARARRYPGNRHGTYFGRLIDYPGPDGKSVDQLAKVITRLKKQAARSGGMTAAYEIDVAHPEDADTPPEHGADITADALVHAADRDNLFRGFPCLSHCSFQLDRTGAVHTVALYRYHYMLGRAYGNYLGLGRLTAYIAERAGLRGGSLTVVAGYAQLDGPITRVRPLLTSTPSLLAA